MNSLHRILNDMKLCMFSHFEFIDLYLAELKLRGTSFMEKSVLLEYLNYNHTAICVLLPASRLSRN